MADFSTLIATLRATIKTNYNQEITGQILQDDLLAIVDAVNRLKQDTLEGYAFHGAPLADGASVSVTQNTFFLVAEGEYTINGSTIEVDAAGVSVIVYDSVNNTTNWHTLFAYDTTPTANSRNAITSGAVAAALAPLATKEDVEAVEQEVAQIAGEAGLAEAVIDTDGAGTEQEFTFRKSGGDGGAYYRKIKGKTIVVDDQLASNDAEAVETTGRNQYNPATGKAQVIGGQTYYIGGTYTSLSQDGVAITPAGDGTFTPASTGEVVVVGGNATDTIINISDADNGLWQPYWKRTLQLGLTTKKDTDGNVPFADGMKGAGTAADWADKVGGEKRMAKVKFSDLSWSYNSTYGFVGSYPITPKIGFSAICSAYPYMGIYTSVVDKSCGYIFNTGFLVKDSTYEGDVDAFLADHENDEVVFELATPVPFTWAEPLNLGVKVDENGTERAVAPEGATAPSAPFVADTTYTMSVARMVEKLQNL